ncbi:hypothetical protein [Acidovorax radicis]|jgi:hypothetical protein|uniref:hypothetical protein n=1 Tax=Acidovorax radicis TaxID=758826 RepID=UPI001CFB8576|nr:hypothetical protein [Acidovorax radicis]UCV00121.1 hypothetical protein KI609_04870 [Acidovorax radicis]
MADRIPTGANAPSAAACAQDFSSSSYRPASSLVIDAQDNAAELRTALQGFAAVEALVTPYGAQDSQNVTASRDQLGALLRMVNSEISRRVDDLEVTIANLRAALAARETLQ